MKFLIDFVWFLKMEIKISCLIFFNGISKKKFSVWAFGKEWNDVYEFVRDWNVNQGKHFYIEESDNMIEDLKKMIAVYKTHNS